MAMTAMAQAHGRAYTAVRAAGLKAPVGVAHHVPAYSALTLIDRPAQVCEMEERRNVMSQ